MNIGNRTSVKSADIWHIEHRIVIWHRYRFGRRRHLAAQRVNSACLLPPGSGNNNYCSTLAHRVHARCHAVCVWSPRGRYPEIHDLDASVHQTTAWVRRGTRRVRVLITQWSLVAILPLCPIPITPSSSSYPYTRGSSPVNAIRVKLTSSAINGLQADSVFDDYSRKCGRVLTLKKGRAETQATAAAG